MTMQEILSALAAIQQDLGKIDLSKDKSVDEIKKMGDAAIKSTDKISADKNFKEEHLKSAVDMFGVASRAVEGYDYQKDVKKVMGDRSKRSEIIDKANARKAVVEKVKGKYDELSKKKTVIEKYKEQFNIEDLVKREQDQLDANDKTIESNNLRKDEVIRFKNNVVNGDLEAIRNNLVVVEDLEKLSKQNAELTKLKADLAAEEKEANPNATLIDSYKSEIKQKESKLKDGCKGFTDTYKMSLDYANLETSINSAKTIAESAMTTAKVEIGKKLNGAEKRYGYKAGFEELIKGKLDAAQTNKEVLAVFDEARRELEAQNINLNLRNGKIAGNIETMNRGQEVLRRGKPTRYDPNKEPTEDEIQSVIEADSEIRALAPVLTDKEMRQKVYESLTENKKGKFHPILFLKSYGKKTQEEWKKSYEKEMREKAVEKIKRDKRETARENGMAVHEVDSKRQKFMDSLMTKVMGADSQTLDKMSKDIEKGEPGETVTKVYDDMEK